MSFATVKAAYLAAIYTTDEFATAAVYTPSAGASSSVTVILSDGAGNEMPGADELGQAAEIRVQTSQIATLAVGETLTVGTDVWEVNHAVKDVDALEWIAKVSRR